MSFHGKPQFLEDKKLITLTDIFKSEGFEIRVVGGAVRDFFMGLAPKDIDFCTNATPDEMVAIAERHGLYLIPTGLQHGTVTFVIDGEPFEVTTLRVDVETDGRHAEVEFTRDFRKDAERRDLTINAMSMDMNGELYDYFDGLHHTRMKRIEFVGDADQRIREDYLRVLRYFRFFARMSPAGTEIDENIISLFKQPHVLEGMKTLSGERIWMELKKILEAPNTLGALTAMSHCGLLDCIVESEDPDHPMLFVGALLMEVKSSLVLLGPKLENGYHRFKEAMTMAALASMVNPKVLDAVVDRLKLSSDERKSLEYLNAVLWTNRYVMIEPKGMSDLRFEFAYEVSCGVEPSLANVNMAMRKSFGGNPEFFKSRIMVNADGDPIYDEIKDFVPFTLNGSDLIARGVKPGKLMGDIIRMARMMWAEYCCTHDSKTLMELLLWRFTDLNQVVCVREQFYPPFKALFMSNDDLEVVTGHTVMESLWVEITNSNQVAVKQYFNVREGAYVDILFADNKRAVEWKLSRQSK